MGQRTQSKEREYMRTTPIHILAYPTLTYKHRQLQRQHKNVRFRAFWLYHYGWANEPTDQRTYRRAEPLKELRIRN